MGGGLRADEWGRDGPVTLLLHGFTGTAAAWGAALLRELARDRRVLAVDLPGHGREGARASESFAETLDRIEATLDHHAVERADWVGYSMGGRLALAGAIERPDRVRRLVLESASPGLATEVERVARRERDAALAEQILREGIEPFVDFWLAQPLFRSQRALSEERREAGRALRLSQSPEGLATALLTLGTGAQPSYWERLGEVQSEVLLLTGSRDEKFEAIAHEMASRLSRVRRRTVEGVGHAVHLEAPTRWLEEVCQFQAKKY